PCGLTLYCGGEASKNETGGGEGIEVLKNEPYEKEGEKGQYTHKIYHLKRAPWFSMKRPGMLTLTAEPVHKLDVPTWKSVEVVPIDIADGEQVAPADYKADEDPALFKSAKTGRGPLGPNWKKELVSKADCPRMCAYKLVTVKFKWWGLQNKQEKRIFTNFHRQLFCWIDKWVELTMEDIRRMEAETQKELEELRKQGQVRGTSAADAE
ncbi:unnamed protein product, partial [Coregonus sp. 'balchen']